MTIPEFLSHLNSLDVRLWAEGDQLRCNAPKGVLTPALQTELQNRKEEILLFLESVDGKGRSTAEVIGTVARDGSLQLSFAQERLWFLYRLFPESPAYNVPINMRLAGIMDISALQKSLQALVDRHESLRTCFPTVDGKPAQLIRDDCAVPLLEHNLTDLPEAKRETAADKLIEEELLRPFDLTHGPVIRAALLRLADQDHILLITVHHIATDGWSRGVIQRDLAALYNAQVLQQTPTLPALPVQYVDFAHWQRQWLSGEVLEDQLRYWRTRLADLSPLALPTDRPRGAGQTQSGASHTIRLSKSLVQGLHALSRQAGVTLATTLLAAFQVLLGRYSGQSDVAVGSPIANRTRLELENLVGFFVNTLVMRTDLSGDPTFHEVLDRVNDGALGAYDHQDLPFDQLVAELQPERDFSRNPLFQVVFAYQNVPREATAFQGLTIRPMAKEITTTRMDLECFVREDNEELRVSLVFNTDLFDSATIERFGTHFQNVLADVVRDPLQRLSQIRLLGETERRQLLVEWNSIRQESPDDRCIHQLFEAQVTRTPEATAVVFGEEQLTYAQLNGRANRVAEVLQQHGVGPDTLVGLCVERSMEMVVGLLGILKSGGAYVPLDHSYPLERLRFMAHDAALRLLLTQSTFEDMLRPLGLPIVSLDNGMRDPGYEAVRPVGATSSGSSLAYVIYTSGSTGLPKGVQVTHANVVRLFPATEAWYDFTERDVWTFFHSHAFDFSVWELLGALFYGGRVVIVPDDVRRSPEEFYRLLVNEQVTVLNQTPAAFRQLIQAEGTLGPSPDLALRYVIFGGEALDLPGLKPWFDRHGHQTPQLVNMYGITETTVHVTSQPISSERLTLGSLIGRPITDLQVYVLDRTMRPLPIGVPGEMYVGGAGLARGYLGRPGLTAERFVPHPFSAEPGARLYKTGDVARYQVDGALEYQGRTDNQVQLRGFRIELGEIEALLSQHPGVAESVALAREDVPGDTRLVAYIVPAEAPLFASDLRQHLKQHVPEYMVPAHFVMLDALPLTPNGKVDRKRLPIPEGGRGGLETEYIAPQMPIQMELAEIWRDVLNVDRVGIHDNFFELGGHSLLATQVVSRVYQAFEVELSLQKFFEAPTVAGIADFLSSAAAADEAVARPQLVPVSREGNLPLSFAQQQLWFLSQLETGSTAYNIARAYKLAGPLDTTALEQSLNEIVQRHEILHTNFLMMDGEPVQVIAPTLTLTLPMIDLCALPESEKEIEVQRLIKQERQWRFDLTQGSLFRATLLRLDQTEHVLCVVVHHIIIDGWSMGIFLEELSTLYDTFSAEKVPSLPKLSIQYADFAVWQRKQLAGKRLEQQLSYWKRQLANLPVLELPTDRPRPPVPTHRGAKQSFTLSQSLSESVKSLTLQEGVTPFATLLAAFSVLLHRYTGQVDIAVGSPIANRTQVETEGLIGYFMNMLILRADLAGNPSFRELLARIRKLALEAYDRQDMPLDERLLKDLQPERDLSRNPLFQIVFVFQNFPTRHPLQLSGLTVTSMEVPSNTAQVDLSLYIRESEEGLEGLFEYNTDLFDDSTIACMVTYLETLLANIVANPDQRLADLPVLTVSEAIEDTYPLSPMQQGMYFHTLQAAQSGVYIEQMVMSLHEDLNLEAFLKSWQQITERHPILRTGFPEQDLLQPLQFVHKQVSLPLKQHDWRDLSAEQQEEHLKAWLQADRNSEFDLTKPPLMRLALFRLAEADYRCIWTFHHILMDGRSFTIVLKEVFSCYQAFCQNQRWSSPIPQPYRDFIDWLAQQPVEASKEFWQELLKGFTSPTSLPTAYLENEEQGYGEQKIQLSETVSSALSTLAQHHQLTLHTLVQGAWAILLSHYNGENDIVFGCTRAGRNTIEKAKSMVGLFINTVPIRVQISPGAPLIDWLKVLRAQWIELRNYEHTPLIKAQEWSDVSPGTPLFNTILVFENYNLNTTLRGQGGEWLQREFNLFERTNYPLTLSCYADSELLLGIEYDLTRFDHKTVSRILDQLKNLLTGMAMGGIEQPLIELPLLSGDERHQLLVEWNDTHRDIAQDVCVHQLFEAQAERTPETIAVVFEGEQLTYRELNRRANQLAHHLRASGVETESAVGLCVERSLEMIIGLLGILKAGGAYLPLDPQYPRERLAGMLADSHASVLLTQNRLLDNSFEYDGKLICLDTDWPIIAQESIATPESDVTDDNTAYIIYTSGSTGKPKGVMIEHRALVNFTEASRVKYAITPNDRVLQFASLSFDASAEEIYPCLTQGATLVLRTDEMLSSAATFWQSCRDSGLTVLDLPTAYWHHLAGEMLTAEPQFPESLRLVIIGGEKAQQKPLATWLEYAPDTIRLVNTYGPTETTVVATMCELLAEAAFQNIPIGHPITNVEAYVLNQHLTPVSIGAPGELYLGGSGLARGYLDNPDLTAERFVPHPFANIPGARLYRTGDLASYRSDGTIEFLGRKDHQVKLRGFRIELGEIENALAQHLLVQKAVVLHRDDGPAGPYLVAYLLTSQDAAVSPDALRNFLRERLPEYMVPSAFVFLDALPRTPNGKVDYRSLPMPDFESSRLETEFVAPQTPTEEQLAKIWREVLGLERVGIHDNFFELGGHSLLATQVISRARDNFEIDLPLLRLFQTPTIAGLTELIETIRVADQGPLSHHETTTSELEEGEL